MTKRWRLFLSILLGPIFLGFGLANIDLEYLPVLWEKDQKSYNDNSAFSGYILFHTVVPFFGGALVPWIGWYRSPLNPINHSSVVNKTNQAGQTLLHIAAFKGNKKHAEVLISNGANLNAQQKYGGMTPLDVANYEKKPKIADLLRKHGGKTGEELKAEGK